MNVKKFLAPVLTLALILGVGAAIYLSVREQATVTVKGLIGSEKEEFFRDERVQAALLRHGLRVEAIKAGSREIATRFNPKDYDFGFPAGVPAAEKIRRDHGIAKFYNIFFTPMTIASWKRVAAVLEANGIVRQAQGIYYIIDMRRLLTLVKERKRWNELPSSGTFSVGKSILINSTDARKSNSGAMYLSLASYIFNGDNVVSDSAQVAPIASELTALFTRQGFTEYSSEAPFEDYLAQGPGKAPLVMIYEAQFLAARAEQNSPVTEEMVLLYPEPTVFTKHILVPFSKNGEKLGETLMSDPELKRLAVEHGFRNDDRALFQDFVKKHQLAVPPDLVNVVDVPAYEIIEQMISLIEQHYNSGGSNGPRP